MSINILEKILADILQVYMNYEESVIDELLSQPDLARKERVCKIDGLEVIIHTNDHNPPHFHVKTRDKEIDAKFSIETGEYLSGVIDSKNLKRIRVFYNSPKTKIILQKVWDKRMQK